MQFREWLLNEGRNRTVYHVSPRSGIRDLRAIGHSKGVRAMTGKGQPGMFVAPKFKDAVAWAVSFVSHKRTNTQEPNERLKEKEEGGGNHSEKGVGPYRNLTVYEIEVPDEVLRRSPYTAWWEPEYFIKAEDTPLLSIKKSKTYSMEELKSIYNKSLRERPNYAPQGDQEIKKLAKTNKAARYILELKDLYNRSLMAGMKPIRSPEDPDIHLVDEELKALRKLTHMNDHIFNPTPITRLTPSQERQAEEIRTRILGMISKPEGPARFREWIMNINEDYKSSVEKFASQNPDVDRDTIQNYVNYFKKIVSKKYKQIFDEIEGVGVPKEKRTNIDAYKTFFELEKVVDYVRGQAPVSGPSIFEDIEVDAPPIFENEEMVVHYADSPRACIKYKGSVPYSWCVSRKDAGNMFYAYRFKYHEPAFYFVKNKAKTKEEFQAWNLAKTAFSGKFRDPWHFFVLQVFKNAKTDDVKGKQYSITSANNDGDKVASWEEVVERAPFLEGHQGMFKPVPISPEEREEREFFSKLNDETFEKLPYEKKSKYIDSYVDLKKPLSDRKFRSLPEDLKNKYVGFGIGLSDDQYGIIRGTKLEKRYREVTLEKVKRLLKGDFDELYDDFPYGLQDSELMTVKDDLDYKSMNLEGIGKLLGLYSTPEEETDEEEGRVIEKGGWHDGIFITPAMGEIMDRYAASKEIDEKEKEIIIGYHPSQSKVLELQGNREISHSKLDSIFKKDFVPKKGFKEEKVKERFLKFKEETLSKDAITNDEMTMLLEYGDPKEIIEGMSESAFKEYFEKENAVAWISDNYSEARKSLANRLTTTMETIQPHPMVLLLADDLPTALKKMGVYRMNGKDIVHTFFGKGYGPKPTEASPERTQAVVEFILVNHQAPLHWVTLKLAQKCPDPEAALMKANPKVFQNIGENVSNTQELNRFLFERKNPELSQKMAENLMASLANNRKQSAAILPTILTCIAYAKDKAKIIEMLGPLNVGEIMWRNPDKLKEIISKMDPASLSKVRSILSEADPKLAEYVAQRLSPIPPKAAI